MAYLKIRLVCCIFQKEQSQKQAISQCVDDINNIEINGWWSILYGNKHPLHLQMPQHYLFQCYVCICINARFENSECDMKMLFRPNKATSHLKIREYSFLTNLFVTSFNFTEHMLYRHWVSQEGSYSVANWKVDNQSASPTKCFCLIFPTTTTQIVLALIFLKAYILWSLKFLFFFSFKILSINVKWKEKKLNSGIQYWYQVLDLWFVWTEWKN